MAALIVSQVWLAALRDPLPAASGKSIHPPGSWKSGNVETFRVSTFNIHRAKGADDSRDVAKTARILGDDDIAGLQEVRGPLWPGGSDQARLIAGHIDTGWLFAPIQQQFYKDYLGNALLSRFPVSSWISEPLIYTDNLSAEHRSRRYRNLLTATVELNEQPVSLMVTHLDRGDIRESQLELVLRRFDRQQQAILMGDLNTTRDSPVMGQWLRGNTSADAIRIALGNADQNNRIDWILTKGFNVTGGGSLDNGISDHPYYWVELTFADTK
jgi:endonuclease/exonuclease/phosphatase family metal-dependent hydrolase